MAGQLNHKTTAVQCQARHRQPASSCRLAIMVLVAVMANATHSVTAQTTDAKPPELQLVSCKLIWDKAPHNAFTDLIRYQDQWVCAFREASKHDGGVRDSKIRLLTSPDGEKWTNAGALSDPRGDVRDAKLSVTPQGKLMLLTALQLFDAGERREHLTLSFFTRDLKAWDGPVDCNIQARWLWGLSWHDGIGYSIGYQADAPDGNDYNANLYTTRDGREFKLYVAGIDKHTNKPNESAIAFAGDTAHCLLRGFGPAYLGTSSPPYDKWTWKRLAVPVGGPELILLPTGRLLGGGRLYLPGKVRTTSLLWVDPKAGSITESLRLPCGGDTSYPGMVWHDDRLFMSYYSSHEGKANIYFAVVK